MTTSISGSTAAESGAEASEPEAPTASPAVLTQHDISAEIAEKSAAQERGELPAAQPQLDYAPYRSSILRHPTKDAHHVDPETIELWAPCFGHRDVGALEADLTVGTGTEEPIGERITVSGRVVDGEGRPVAGQLVEIWQANAAGRYIHKYEQHPAPIDPNFYGVGRCLTGPNGEYSFRTIKPGPYPWGNHLNAWRPAHIHFSLFGTAFSQRLITQMYFPSDPLFDLDPIFSSITDPRAREALIATYDHDQSVSEFSMGYNWDIVLTGSRATWMEEGR